MAIKRYRTAVFMLSVILLAGFAAWFFFSTLGTSKAQTPSQTAVAVTPDQSAVATTPDPSQAEPDAAPAAAQPQGGALPQAAEPLDHIRISRQYFSRGGLGSKALVTFTLRNDNDYAVKDLEILCSFRSKDGRYSTERRRTITEIVNTRSRRTFPHTLVGFVNIKASHAKCSLLTASRA